MIRAFLLLLAAFIATPASAQSPEPVLRLEVDPESVVPGQPVTARLTLLVPTFLPEPPQFPTFETPNVITRLPERASGPVSERIDGETWAGITRAYRLTPMIPGPVTIPPQPVTVTYADPDGGAPIRVTLRTPEFSFEGTIPEAAAGLDPFIAAISLTLIQQIDGDPAALAPGDALVRTVTATIDGVSPLFLPPLIPDIADLPSYPDAPAVTETDDRGTPAGTRIESVTYVPATAGTQTAPPITLDWFNLDTGNVETATAPGFDITTTGGPVADAARAVDWRATLPSLAALFLAAALLTWLARRFAPALATRREARHTARRASESHAYAEVRTAAAARDAPGLFTALTVWAARLPAAPASDSAETTLAAALAALGRARYGNPPGDPPPEAWERLAPALDAARTARLAGAETASDTSGLPALNPA